MLISLEGAHAFCVSIFGRDEHLRDLLGVRAAWDRLWLDGSELKAAFEWTNLASRVEGSPLSCAQPRDWVRPYKCRHRQSVAVGSRPCARLKEEVALRCWLRAAGERPAHHLLERMARQMARATRTVLAAAAMPSLCKTVA